MGKAAEAKSMGQAVLGLENVELTLAGNAGRVEILRGITLEVDRGESIGLVGPSGSGKSSLLMLMGGLERPTAGRVTALGQELSGMDEDGLARFRRGRMGIVFQSFHLVPTMTARENVALPLRVLGQSEADYRPNVEELLDWVGLGERMHVLPPLLSGGEKQRVAIARALFNAPALILADELHEARLNAGKAGPSSAAAPAAASTDGVAEALKPLISG